MNKKIFLMFPNEDKLNKITNETTDEISKLAKLLIKTADTELEIHSFQTNLLHSVGNSKFRIFDVGVGNELSFFKQMCPNPTEKGIRSLYSNPKTPGFVYMELSPESKENKDPTPKFQLLSSADVIKSFCNITRGHFLYGNRFVKICFPMFNNDIGQVIIPLRSSRKILIKHMPRIDYEELEKSKKGSQRIISKLKTGYIPPLALFSRHKIEALGGKVESFDLIVDDGHVIVDKWDDEYFFKGFQYSMFEYTCLKTRIRPPDESEISIFNENSYPTSIAFILSNRSVFSVEKNIDCSTQVGNEDGLNKSPIFSKSESHNLINTFMPIQFNNEMFIRNQSVASNKWTKSSVQEAESNTASLNDATTQTDDCVKYLREGDVIKHEKNGISFIIETKYPKTKMISEKDFITYDNGIEYHNIFTGERSICDQNGSVIQVGDIVKCDGDVFTFLLAFESLVLLKKNDIYNVREKKNIQKANNGIEADKNDIIGQTIVTFDNNIYSKPMTIISFDLKGGFYVKQSNGSIQRILLSDYMKKWYFKDSVM